MTTEQQLNNALLLLGAKELELALLRQEVLTLRAQRDAFLLPGAKPEVPRADDA